MFQPGAWSYDTTSPLLPNKTLGFLKEEFIDFLWRNGSMVKAKSREMTRRGRLQRSKLYLAQDLAACCHTQFQKSDSDIKTSKVFLPLEFSSRFFQKILFLLLHMPYRNRAALSYNYIPKKSFKILELWSLNRYKMDLLNEVLNIEFDHEAANILEVKVGGWKKYLPTLPTTGAWVQTGLIVLMYVWLWAT